MEHTYYLYSRDSKGKIRVLIITIENPPLLDCYNIKRQTGLLDGKLIEQPIITIEKGKAGRTLKEQVELQVNSIINKQRDKGYKLLSELTSGDVDPMDHDEINELLPIVKTYVNGNKKLMLAKDPKVGSKYYDLHNKSTKVWDKLWYASRKLDGIRAAVVFEDGTLKAFSRTGKSLDVAFTNIFRNLDLTKISQIIGEDKMIDGELYIHGRSLQQLSGICALKEYDPIRHDDLEFWIFDYADDTSTAKERAETLNGAVKHLEGKSVKINLQLPAQNYSTMEKLHDLWVLEGYEGLIARDATKVYGYGKRDDRMLKLKMFQDDEFEIVGHKLGLRGAEDMCFICKTKDGKTFDPKPIGDKQTKIDYVKNISNLVGKKGTVKFFHYTDEGIPGLCSFIAVRDYE